MQKYRAVSNNSPIFAKRNHKYYYYEKAFTHYRTNDWSDDSFHGHFVWRQ